MTGYNPEFTGQRLDASMRAVPNILDRSDPAAPEVPRFTERAKGAYLWDTAGRSYLDFILGFGSVVLGHADDTVDNAVIDQLRKGVSPTLRTLIQVELAALINQYVPNADMSLPLRTGSDATEAAVRVARAYTGRKHVFRWGYQGWHDWCAPRPPGVPESYRSYTSVFTFNDLDSLKALFREHRGDVACVIMMPLEIDEPQQGFLARCRQLAHEHDALFVLDEIRTGFRLAMGGAQEHYNIAADLVALSKAMGNGYAISAVAGSAEIMSVVEEISLSSVFFRSADGMAAAVSTIRQLAQRNVPDLLWGLGREFMAGLRDAAGQEGVPAKVVGIPPMPYHSFDLPAELGAVAHREFCRAAAQAGVLFHPTHHWFVCAAMSKDDMAHAIAAARVGYRAVRRMISG